MATSGNFQKAITSWLNLRVEWVANSQNVSTNKTNLTVTAYLVSTASNGVINSSASKTINLTINGTTYSYSAASLAKISGNQKKKLFSKTVDVAHNANGTKSCSISCDFGIQVTLGGTYYGTVSTSGTATLNTIPRASQPSCITYPATTKNVGNIGSSFRIHMNRATSSFTHYVYCKWGTETVEIGKNVEDNIDWTIPENFANEIPNATSGNGTIYVDTYNGSTKIGSASVGFTATVPASYKPSISDLTIAEAVSGLASKFGVYVQNQSKAKVTITAAGSHGSTIKLYTTTLTNGSTVLTYNGASFTSGALSLSGTYTVKTVVTDSRGRTAENSTTISVVAYSPPEVNDLIVQRWNIDTNAADDEGEYLHYSVKAKVAPVNNKNVKQFKFEYRISGDSTWASLLDWAEMSAYTLTDYDTFATPKFSPDNAYEIRVLVKDYFTANDPAKKMSDLPTARTIFDVLYDGTGMCIGGVASQSGVCQIDMRTQFKGGQINLNAQDETDLNQFKQPNVYVSKNNAAETYANLPKGITGTFTLEVMSAGQEGQLLQRLTVCNKDFPDIRERHFYGGAWGDWQRVGGSYTVLTARLSADTTTVSGVYTKLTLAQDYRIGESLSVSDGAIKIGAGIKAVKVSANIVFNTLKGNGAKHVKIKAGSKYVSWASETGNTGETLCMSLVPKVIAVSENDLIELQYYSPYASETVKSMSSAGDTTTYLTVEVVA